MEQTLFTRAQLKDSAKDALEGNYKKIIPVIFLTGLMTLAIQLTVEFFASFFFSLILIGSDMSANGLTPDQMVVLLQNTSYLEEYKPVYAVIDYVIQAVFSVLTSVFHVGLTLICLNIACGRDFNMTDIFYGFRTQFRKSLGISTAFVAVSQLWLIPWQLMQQFLPDSQNLLTMQPLQTNTDRTQLLTVLCLLLVGTAIYLPVSLAISQAYLLLLDFPDRSAKDILKLSVRIMQGHKLRLFLLELSFLPLVFLGFLSFGIGNLWLTPYMQVAYAVFFLNLMRSGAARE